MQKDADAFCQIKTETVTTNESQVSQQNGL